MSGNPPLKVMRAWDRGRNKIAYVYRDEETGKTKIGETKFQNWFYVKTPDFHENRSVFYKYKEEKTITGFEDVGKYHKIFIDTVHNDDLLNKDMEWVWEYKNFNVNKMLERLKMMNIQTYEADVKAFKRWLLRDDVEIDNFYKVCYYDIETDDRHADGLTPGKYRILSVAMKYSDSNNLDGKMVWICTEEDTDEAEKAMLEKLAKVINAFDVLVSFNGMNFDDPYIKSRFMRYGIQIDWRKKFLQDHCWTYKKYGEKLIKDSLDYIARHIVGRGKVDHTGMHVYDMWLSDRALLKEYNVEDVQLMFDIEVKTKFLATHRDICMVGKCPVDDLYVSRKIDNLILKQAEEDNEYHFKTVERDEEVVEEKLEGAFVFKPVGGRYKSVRVFDFSSLYPSLIDSFNISLDTLISGNEDLTEDQIIKTPTKHRYRKDFIGILPKVVNKVKAKRNYYKGLMAKEEHGSVMHKVYDKLQYVYKYFALSFYGTLGEKHQRFYDIRVAESVTLTGQYFIKQSAAYLERNKFQIICGQTDSLFVGGIKKSEHVFKLCEVLNELCKQHATKKFNTDKCSISMEYDKGFKTFFLGSAKLRYAGVLDYLDGHAVDGGEIYVKGFELVRTDSTELVRIEQKKLFNVMLLEEEMPPAETIRNFILELKDRTFSGKLSLDNIMISQRIKKELDEYPGRQMHVAVAREMIKDGKEFWIGDKKPIAKPVYKFEGRYCESYYWNNKIFPPLQRILEVAYPNIDWSSYKAKGSGEVKTGRTNLW